jgi:hypothetical protein
MSDRLSFIVPTLDEMLFLLLEAALLLTLGTLLGLAAPLLTEAA